ncbi:MAG: site-specific integrase [Anaerolineae bacterium]
MGADEIEEYLTYLAVERNVAASTQNQALSALLFLYQNVLKKDLERPVDAVRAKKPKRLPTVLTKEEAQQVLAAMSGPGHRRGGGTWRHRRSSRFLL